MRHAHSIFSVVSRAGFGFAERACLVDTMSGEAPALTAGHPRRRRWLTILLGIVAVLVLWLVHPFLLASLEKAILTHLASRAGLRLEVGSIHSNLTQPITFYDLKLRAQDANPSQTAIDVESVEFSLNWPWEMVFGPGRIFHNVTVMGLRGIFDGRPRAAVPPATAPATGDQKKQPSPPVPLRYIPQAMVLVHSSMEFLAEGQSYYLDDVSAGFNESQLEKFHASGAEVRVGDLQQSFGSLDGITAWKEGSAYLADLPLLDGVTIENFRADLAQGNGVSLDLEATLYGGMLQGNVAFGEEGAIDAAVWLSNLKLERLSSTLNLHASTEGLVREARLTFRGSPVRPLDAEASLRVSADGFRWNQRGWESLTIGANLIHRRLVISDFRLRQKDNAVNGSGEISLAEGWRELAKAPFVVNGSASIQDISALASLVGPPFAEMAGRMSLNGSLSGKLGKLEGYLTLEASNMKFRNRAVTAANVDVVFANNDAQVERCEVWSGDDYVRGHGTVGVSSPHSYSGEVQARAMDLAAYARLFPSVRVPAISSGALQLRWQGDGTKSAHSGAFTVSLDKFVSESTPSGLTGRFAGTYSPQNIYFSGFELEQGPLRFSTRATLASSGIVLQDGVLRSGNKNIASANIFLPIDPFAVVAGKPWIEAINPARDVYVSATAAEPVGLREALHLIGRDRPLQGSAKFDVHASGPPAALTVKAKLEADEIALRLEKGATPGSKLSLLLQAEKGTANLTAQLATQNLPAASFQGQFPFGFVQKDGAPLQWGDPNGPLTFHFDVQKMPIAAFAPYFAVTRAADGILTASGDVSGTQGKPAMRGAVSLSEGRLAEWPQLSNLTFTLTADGGSASVSNGSGKLGEGAFVFDGHIALADFWHPQVDFTFSGRDLSMVDIPAAKIRADLDLKGAGNDAGGRVGGKVDLTDCHINKRLEITPTVSSSVPSADTGLIPPRLSDLEFLKNWKLDLAVTNKAPLVFFGNLPATTVGLDLRLVGTAGAPVPVGRITVEKVPAFLPFTGLNIESGHLDFFENSPWTPQVELHATARALDYDVQIYAFGPLNERRAVLRSDPPLSQESLSLLLATGLAPGIYAQKLPIAQTSKPLDPSFNALQPAAPRLSSGQAILRERVRLWEGLLNRRDDMNFSEGSVAYSFRFR